MEFSEDTEVVLTHPQKRMASWTGMRCKVVKNVNCPDGLTFLEPLEQRPDGRGNEDFFWTTEYLRKAD